VCGKREKKFVSVCKCVSAKEINRERARECVFVCETRKRYSWIEREKERESKRERESVCVCV